MARWMLAAAFVLGLAGCGASLPKPDEIAPTAPAGLALPLKARVMLFVAQADLERKLAYDVNLVSVEVTDIKEGEALAQAAQALLAKAFATVATNQPSIRPQVVARVTGKAVWDRKESTFRINCEIFATDAGGGLIGRYFDIYRSPSVLSLESSLAPAFGQCLKRPLDEFLRSPGLAELARAGFPEPVPAVGNAYLRSQGFVIPGQ